MKLETTFIVLSGFIAFVCCGHKTVKIEVPFKIHTIHHHHTEKVPVIKKVEVPVIKEVKVPFPVHVPVKVPYPIVLKPHVVYTHTHEHKHEHEDHHSHHDEDHHEEGVKYAGNHYDSDDWSS